MWKIYKRWNPGSYSWRLLLDFQAIPWQLCNAGRFVFVSFTISNKTAFFQNCIHWHFHKSENTLLAQWVGHPIFISHSNELFRFKEPFYLVIVGKYSLIIKQINHYKHYLFKIHKKQKRIIKTANPLLKLSCLLEQFISRSHPSALVGISIKTLKNIFVLFKLEFGQILELQVFIFRKWLKIN